MGCDAFTFPSGREVSKVRTDPFTFTFIYVLTGKIFPAQATVLTVEEFIAQQEND
jgi:hypothetical protein